jgi:hypothetical protein
MAAFYLIKNQQPLKKINVLKKLVTSPKKVNSVSSKEMVPKNPKNLENLENLENKYLAK